MRITKKAGMALLAALMSLIGLAAGAWAGNYVEGEVMVVLRAEGAAAFPLSTGLLTRTKAQSAAARAAAEVLTARVASEVGAYPAETHAALSSHEAGVFALLKSHTKSTEQLMAELKKHPGVICVSPNYIVHTMAIPNDYANKSLWGMALINAPAAWDITQGSENLYAAVIDSGIRKTHEDFPGVGGNPGRITGINLIESERPSDYITDDFGHGTHVSGIIGAAGNNGRGVTGINWKVSLMILRIFDRTGAGDLNRIVKGFAYLTERLTAGDKIPAVNLSLGGYAAASPEDMASSALYRAFKQFDSLNKTVIVVAAGNENVAVGKPTPSPIYVGGKQVPAGSYVYPASFIGLNNMIVVGSVWSDAGETRKSGFSNYSNAYVHLIAPGGAGNDSPAGADNRDIWSTYNDSDTSYGTMPGTSMAAPYVTGAAALVASKSGNGNLTAAQLKSHLLSTSARAVNPDNMSLYGLLDIGRAVSTETRDVSVSAVTIKPGGSVNVPLNETKTFAAVVAPEEATDKRVIWTSSNSAAATVDEYGTVTTRASGETTLTAASLSSSSIKGEVKVVVVSSVQPGNGGSPNGNCGSNVGFGMSALLLAGGVLLRKRRRDP
ncbi:MAG: S8 family serine peptidase [Synergistaceae bacterium]|jgi:subtilisin family serine protease|nr:S8 family serine peptidase [Synergistaceae bacterium]